MLFASLIGTAIEFFLRLLHLRDICATAAVLVFPRLFFPASDPAAATLASLATFAIASNGTRPSVLAAGRRGTDVSMQQQRAVEHVSLAHAREDTLTIPVKAVRRDVSGDRRADDQGDACDARPRSE